MDREPIERVDSTGRPIWALGALWLLGCVVALVGAVGDGGPTGRLCLAGLAAAGLFASLSLLVLMTRSADLSPLERFVGVFPMTILLAGAGLFWADYRLNEMPVAGEEVSAQE